MELFEIGGYVLWYPGGDLVSFAKFQEGNRSQHEAD